MIAMEVQQEVDVFGFRDNESPTLSIANTKFYVSEDVGSDGYQLELPVTRIIENSTISYEFAVTGGTAVAGTDYNVSTGRKTHPGYRPIFGLSQFIPIGILGQ